MLLGAAMGITGALIGFIRKAVEIGKKQDEEAETMRKQREQDEV